MGICSSRESFGPIDYSLSVRQIYTHTARDEILHARRIDIVCVKAPEAVTSFLHGYPIGRGPLRADNVPELDVSIAALMSWLPGALMLMCNFSKADTC